MPESSLPRHAGRRVALVALLVASASLAAPATAQAPLPIFDAHLHYSHDAWAVSYTHLTLPTRDLV